MMAYRPISDQISHPPSRRGRARSLACCAALLCLVAAAHAQKTAGGALGSLLGTNQPKPATEAPAPTPAPSTQPGHPSAIPLPDVAARSEDLKRQLRSISNQLPAADQLQSAQDELDERDTELDSREKEVEALLAGMPSTLELREQDHYWRTEQKQTAELRGQLLDWANAAQSAMQEVGTQTPIWQVTLEQNEHTLGLQPTLQVIQQTLDALQRLGTQAQDQLKTIVNLQVRAASQDQVALDTMDRVSKVRERIDRRLLERDSLPLWRLSDRRQMGENSQLYVSAASRLGMVHAFAAHVRGALVALFLLLLASMFGAYRLYRATRGVEPGTPARATALLLVRRWWALGLLPPVWCSYLLAPLAPLPLISLVTILSFVPILSLLPPLIPARLRLLLYGLSGVYLVSACVAWTGFSPFYKRQAQFLIYVIVFAVFAHLLRPARMSRVPDGERIRGERLFLLRAALAVLGFSIVANFFGYMKLAQFLGVLILYSTFIAISMITGVQVFTLLLLEGLETAAAQQLAMVRCHGSMIARWVPRVLQTGAMLIWFVVTMNLLGLGAWLTGTLAAFSNFHIAGGSYSITLGGVIGFFVILLVGYAISASIRFLLREELLSRFHMARGVPDLIATTLHYLLLLLVFFFAVNAGGVELNKFTVLTGALGVGVGFGLQNIVNNFISGLILQFERPIHIGDVLEVDGINGTVTRIGIRSSTVRTFQGAELIIPNGSFISGKVTNWTLTNPQRRLELPVGVGYGSDAKTVARLLEQAATEHESVLTAPPPAVYFKEFGDSALNFELQFWVMQESNTTRVKSEVALRVMELLTEGGIEIPFPQRDLRLRSVDPEAAALLSPNGSQAGYEPQLEPRPEPSLVGKRAQRQRAGE